MNRSPLSLPQWMRRRLPELNRSLDESPNASLLAELCEGVLGIIPNEDNSREVFTYLSMVHMSLYHHRENMRALSVPLPENFDAAFQKIENTMIDLAEKIGVEHRFLASFYLLYNPEIDGLAAQFRSGNDEAEFAGANRIGVVEFRAAALSLLEAAKLLARRSAECQAILTVFEQALASFDRIVDLNRGLAQRLSRHEFELLTKYFSSVEVHGRALRGVNAGDQPWSYIIDLLLGVDLKHVFETAFNRVYPAHVTDSSAAIRQEFELNDYLRKRYLLPEDYARLEETLALASSGIPSLLIAIEESFTGGDRERLTALLQEVIKQYVMTSNTHFGLAKKYVPVDPQTHQQIGSSGTNIEKFLRQGLIDERMKVLYGQTRVPIS